LVEAGTREAAQGGTAEDFATLVATEFVDQHGVTGKSSRKYTRQVCKNSSAVSGTGTALRSAEGSVMKRVRHWLA
jgi:hypothetical protein